MAIKTRADYIASLRRLRPNVYKFGERIEDVTTHPATRRVVESHARAYDAAQDPELSALFTATSALTGEKVHRHNSLMQSCRGGNPQLQVQTGNVPTHGHLHRQSLCRMERHEHDVGDHP